MSDTTELIADALRLDIAHARKDAAYQAYCYAGSNLERTQIEERRAELFTTAFQYVGKGELFGKFGELSPRERDLMRAIARYVVIGRVEK